MSALDAYKIRQDFAILDQVVMMNLWYTWIMQQRLRSLKVVLDTLMAYYHEDNANVHRGVHTLAERAQLLTKLVVKSFVSLSMLNQPKRSSLHVERQLVLTGLVVLQSRFLSQEMRWLFQLWNTTRISFLGRKLVRRRGLNLFMPT
mgnify:CR=1 FL=1